LSKANLLEDFLDYLNYQFKAENKRAVFKFLSFIIEMIPPDNFSLFTPCAGLFVPRIISIIVIKLLGTFRSTTFDDLLAKADI
jgi:hypothetical protein